MVPDQLNIDRVALISTFLVTAGQTVRPGYQVKYAASQTNPNIREVQECTTVSDVGIGIAGGILGDTAFASGSKINVTCYYHVVQWAIAGTGGVTIGARVAADPGGLGLSVAPASNPAGATLTFSPGFSNDVAASGEGFALLYMPHCYVTT